MKGLFSKSGLAASLVIQNMFGLTYFSTNPSRITVVRKTSPNAPVFMINIFYITSQYAFIFIVFQKLTSIWKFIIGWASPRTKVRGTFRPNLVFE